MTSYDEARIKVVNPEMLETLRGAYYRGTHRRMVRLGNEVFVFPIEKPIEFFLDYVFPLDVVELLSRLPGESVDVIFTDEPYGVRGGVLNFHGEDRVVETHFKWDEAFPSHITMPWVYHAARVLKPGGVLINCGMASWATTYEAVAIDAGLTFRAHIAWYKPNSPPRLRRGGWRSSFEELWIASKGSLKDRQRKVPQSQLANFEMEIACPECHALIPFNWCNDYNVIFSDDGDFAYNVEYGPYTHHVHRDHPTQKPEWLAAKYLHMLTKPGDIVLDPFCGSGEILVTAKRMGCRIIGNDYDPSNEEDPGHWAKYTRERLQSVQISVL